jgi:hypothetical protein
MSIWDGVGWTLVGFPVFKDEDKGSCEFGCFNTLAVEEPKLSA